MVEPVGSLAKLLGRVVAPSAPASAVRAAPRVADDADRAQIALPGVARGLAVTPPVDAERVAQIKQAIANGTYPIAPETIADRLLALKLDWKSGSND
ncbi:MAG: flagellar biosynthesis anti-sigma factor FlgM [Pseudomonadota bacterium]